jgi:glycerol uptake facilitator-like aquaporin
MIKLLYKPVDLIASMVGGLLAGLIFKTVWKLIGQGDAPKPTDERRGWGEILLAAMLQGTIFALVKTAADRGAAEGTRRLTGIWPGDEGQQPDESL